MRFPRCEDVPSGVDIRRPPAGLAKSYPHVEWGGEGRTRGSEPRDQMKEKAVSISIQESIRRRDETAGWKEGEEDK